MSHESVKRALIQQDYERDVKAHVVSAHMLWAMLVKLEVLDQLFDFSTWYARYQKIERYAEKYKPE